MSPTEAIPLLVVVLLMVSVGGGDVQEMTVTFEGDTTPETLQDVHVVAGGSTTVSAGTAVAGDIYVIGGGTRIDGTVDGDVTLLAGTLVIGEKATVSGTVRPLSGDSSIAETADIGSLTKVQSPAPNNSPLQRIGGFIFQFLVLGLVGMWLVSRHPFLLRNVGNAITAHPLASGVVGSLGATTLLVLFVYMAFTILLIPVAILGLIGELLVVLYGQIVFGYLVGTRLSIENSSVATIVGIGIFLLVFEAVSFLPYLGGIIQLGVAAVGFGAVLNTYFGFSRFEPVTIPG